MIDPRAAVVTGIGLSVPGASSLDELWALLGRGLSDSSPRRVEEKLPCEEEDRGARLACLSVQRAIAEAGLSRDDLAGRDSVGCSFSSSKGGILSLLEAHECFFSRGPEGISSSAVERMTHGGVNSRLCAEFGAIGPAVNLVAACATGIASLGRAREWIEEGHCDIVLAGSSEAGLHPLLLAGFDKMGVLSHSIPRPLDSSRDGFVPGEGAVAFVVESFERARRRGVKIHSLLKGAVVLGDAYHETNLHPSGRTIVRSIQTILERAGMNKEEISAVNLHATGTRAGDPVEARALRACFGDRLDYLPVSAVKGATGHLLGAAGSLEAAVSLLSIKNGHIPPTVNLDSIDPECAAGRIHQDYAPCAVQSVLSLSYGFGGHVGALLLEKFS